MAKKQSTAAVDKQTSEAIQDFETQTAEAKAKADAGTKAKADAGTKESKENERIKAAQTGSFLPKKVAERANFHVKLDKPLFDPKSGKKLSKAYIQQFTPSEWAQFQANAKVLGYEAEVMWDPTKY